MQEIIGHKDIKAEDWQKLIGLSENLSPFHSPEFHKFCNSTSNQRGEVYAVKIDGELKALAVVCIIKEKGIKGFFSRRAIMYDMPLFTDLTALRSLLESLGSKLKSKAIYTEIRNYSKVDKQPVTLFNELGWDYLDYMNVIIDLKDKNADDVLMQMDSERRRQIRKSLKEGASCETTINPNDATALYAILKDLYATRVKVPIPDIDYFINLMKSDIGKVFIVKHNGKIIGGSFCLMYPEGGIYTLYYCGLKDYNKKIRPTNLVVFGIVEYAISNGLKVVDLMGAGRKEEKYGVRDFKKAFGGDFFESGRFLLVNSKLLYGLGKKALQMIQKLKK